MLTLVASMLLVDCVWVMLPAGTVTPVGKPVVVLSTLSVLTPALGRLAPLAVAWLVLAPVVVLSIVTGMLTVITPPAFKVTGELNKVLLPVPL